MRDSHLLPHFNHCAFFICVRKVINYAIQHTTGLKKIRATYHPIGCKTKTQLHSLYMPFLRELIGSLDRVLCDWLYSDNFDFELMTLTGFSFIRNTGCLYSLQRRISNRGILPNLCPRTQSLLKRSSLQAFSLSLLFFPATRFEKAERLFTIH